eukprot:CAMPEP_0196129510 /NCGR_PEP_ID=MMETSP0910-20130528/134_1 /TAXON_ID=49265 /ORGANISM="Thalassiosira rotula, Strain GSO102" /LENGTH=164 /DNA_ID=CAMNT_0041388619 /DNA_START=163 /DNA_END=657 /DNA_ORIENTATION=-
MVPGNDDMEHGMSQSMDDQELVMTMNSIDLPSESLSQVERCDSKKNQKLSGMQKYNIIVEEANVLANIVSKDYSKYFNKAKTILKFVQTHIQPMGGEALKTASSDYLGLSNKAASLQDSYGLMNEIIMLAPILKKTSEKTGIKRKNHLLKLQLHQMTVIHAPCA